MAAISGSITEIINTHLARNEFNAQDSIVLITKQLIERNREERASVAIDYERADYVRASKEIARMTKFKDKVADNVAAANKARSALEWAESYLTSAKTELTQLLGSTSGTDRAAAASVFDGFIQSINSRVSGANVTVDGYRNVNLVGNTRGPDWKTDTIFTPTSDKGAGFAVIEGTFLGVDFQVTDAGGLNWRLDAGANTFYQYKNDGSGERTGLSVSAEGLTVDSYDAATGAITYGGSGSLSGSLTRAGLGLLQSQYYDNFADDTSVQTAINDVDAALITLSRKGASIIADAALLEGRIDLVNSKIENFEDEKDRIRAEELDASKALSKAADVKLRLALDNINLLSSLNNGLVENMVALSAGPSPAQGLFGIMGY